MSHRRCLSALLVVGLLVPSLPAAEGSLQWIPADAAFYSGIYRNREQIEAVVQSRAFKKLSELPLIKKALAQAAVAVANPPDPNFAELLRVLREPENAQLLSVLGDMFSDDVFVFGGESAGAFAELLAQLQGGVQAYRIATRLQGQQPNDPQSAARFFLEVLKENEKLIQTPELVFGFKVRDSKAAEAQLERLRELLEPLIAGVPQLRGRFKKIDSPTGEVLQLSLDGKMVPWDDLPIKDLEEEEGEFDNLVKKLAALKLSVSLGVRNGYVLLAFGESLAALDRLGGKGPRLADRPELKPIGKVQPNSLTSVSYASASLRKRLGFNEEDVEGLTSFAIELLANAPLKEEQRKKIEGDIRELGKSTRAGLVEPGAQVAFAFRTDRGIESYGYDYTPAGKPKLEPLGLLNHLGGDPIFASVSRSPLDPKVYRNGVKWLTTTYSHLEEALLSQIDDDPRQQYEQISKIVFPLLRRLDTITGTMLLPALADGQAAFVFDGKWQSRQWHQAIPPMPQALPLPEIGIVLGVSDADLLRKAMDEYRKWFNEAYATARRFAPEQLPEHSIPAPTTKPSAGGDLYFYAMPKEWGLDPQVLPTAGLSKNVAVLTLSNGHAERLLKSTPLTAETAALADGKTPLLSATLTSNDGLIDLFSPWVMLGLNFGLQQAQREGGLPPDLQPQALLPQVSTVLEVIKVFRGGSSTTTVIDGVTVTRTETVIRDLK